MLRVSPPLTGPLFPIENLMYMIFGSNGQKREYPVLFGQRRMYPENNSGRECCWPYLIGQHPLSPVFGQKRPGTPGNSYFAQLPPVLGHFIFRFGPFYVSFRWATSVLEQINMSHKNNCSAGLPLTSLCDRPLLFVYFQVNNGVLYCFWIMKILVIMVLCCARFNYCIGFVFIV